MSVFMIFSYYEIQDGYFPWVILDQSIWSLWLAMVQLCEDHLALRNRCLQNTPGEFPLTERIEGIIVKLSSWPSGMISNKDRTKIEMTSSSWHYWAELDTFLDVGKHPWLDIFSKNRQQKYANASFCHCKWSFKCIVDFLTLLIWDARVLWWSIILASLESE